MHVEHIALQGQPARGGRFGDPWERHEIGEGEARHLDFDPSMPPLGFVAGGGDRGLTTRRGILSALTANSSAALAP